MSEIRAFNNFKKRTVMDLMIGRLVTVQKRNVIW